MTTTLLLDQTIWDLCLDVDGNIAVASDPYATAQCVANAVRTFLGELWYDTPAGLPYFQQVLGKLPNIQMLKSLILAQTNTVSGVSSAVVYLTNISFSTRTITGQIQFVDSTGITQVASF